jgi:hypothetical protein
MTEIFPQPIRDLPEADIPLQGIKTYLSQSDITFSNEPDRYAGKQ